MKSAPQPEVLRKATENCNQVCMQEKPEFSKAER